MKAFSRTIKNLGKILIITVLALSIAACELMGPRKVEEPIVTQPEQIEEPPLPLPTDSLSPSQRLSKALKQLQQGDYENARNQLNWALLEKPDLSIASKLLEQMDADPFEYLGLKNFDYDVQSGDSLSLLAKGFLNDPLKFVILARYNKLDNPSKLAPGQRIQIPGEKRKIKRPKHKAKPRHVESTETKTTAEKQPAVSVQETAAPKVTEQMQTPAATITPALETEETTAEPVEADSPNIDQILESAKKLQHENDLPAAIYLLESENKRQPQSEEIRSLLANYYNEHADHLIAQNDLTIARATLEKLIILDTSDKNAINKLIFVEDRIEAQKLLEKANTQQQNNKPEEAYQTYKQVLTYDPNNLTAKEQQLKVRNQLTDSYHRQAMQLFRKQELDEAIDFWNKILELDPNHSLAPGYKARALEMKQQLQKIDSE